MWIKTNYSDLQNIFNLHWTEFNKKTRYSLFKLIIFIGVFWGGCTNSELNVCKHLGQEHVYHCLPSAFLQTTLTQRLGDEDTSCWSIVEVNFLPVWGFCCHILRFVMLHTCSMGDRSGLYAGRPSFPAKPCCCNPAACGFIVSLK